MKATERLIDVAAAVSDGAVVNWGRTASESNPAERDLIGHLRLLERIASVHATLPPVGVFERSLHDSLWRSASARPTSPADAPATWGALTIEERLGSGTYADVYRARDPRLDRPVALKLLRHRDGGTAAESETIEEARLLARVRHPSVVTVYGAERIDGRVGIWMELVDGRTLEQDLRDRGPFSAEDLVSVGTALCRALGAVHGAGLLHRDVKAQNVMRDRDGRVLLTDFGTGRELADLGSARELAGTPLYLAPEVLNGQPASAASDIYSLGVLLYHLATGSFPVSGRSLRDLREAHARGSYVPLIQARPDLPERLASVIDRAAATDIGRRYESGAALETALIDAVDSRASRRRTRAIVLALVLTLGCLLTGYAIRRWLVQGRPAQPRLTVTQLTFNSAELTTFAAAISPDGKYLAYADRTGLVVKTVSNSQEHRISLSADIEVQQLVWLPDSSGLLAAGPSGVWRTSALLDAPRRIFSTGGWIAVSSTGLLAIAHGTNSIRLATPNGEEVREIADPEPLAILYSPFWSPDGRRIGYAREWSDRSGGHFAFETRRVDGGERTMLVSRESIGAAIMNPVWTPDGRVLFARNQRPPNGRYQELWGIRVDAVTGRALSDPVSLWQAPEFTFHKPSLTVDGKSLVFLASRLRIGVYTADFDPIAVRLTGLRKAVLRDSETFGPSWTQESSAIVFTSGESGTSRAYRQDLAQGDPREFPASPVGEGTRTILSPDNTWLLYVSNPPRVNVMRVRTVGGTPEPLFNVPSFYSSIACAQTAPNVCVVGSLVDGHVKLTVFDPARGVAGRQYELPASDPDAGPRVALSPDGTEILSLDETSPTVQPFLLNLSTGNVRQLSPQPWTGAVEASWTADGKGWIVVKPTGHNGCEVLYIDRDGRSRHLWASTFQRLVGPMVSPDGRHIAFQSGMTESAVWMLQGF